jgi:hypothetical protein
VIIDEPELLLGAADATPVDEGAADALADASGAALADADGEADADADALEAELGFSFFSSQATATSARPIVSAARVRLSIMVDGLRSGVVRVGACGRSRGVALARTRLYSLRVGVRDWPPRTADRRRGP